MKSNFFKFLGAAFFVVIAIFLAILYIETKVKPVALEVPVTIVDMVDIGDEYVPYNPYLDPEVVNQAWELYEEGMKDYSFEVTEAKSSHPRDNGTYQGMCQTLLERFSLWSGNLTTYENLFFTCTGEQAQKSSIAYLWSIYGLGNSGTWTNGYDEEDSGKWVTVMTFSYQPPNSTIVGVLTPCDKSYPELISGMKIENVFPATQYFWTMYNGLNYHKEDGFEISFSFDGKERPSTVSVLEGSFFGFIAHDEFFTQELDVRDNVPMSYGTIYLYEVEGCR